MKFRDLLEAKKVSRDDAYEAIIAQENGKNKVINAWIESMWNSENYVPDETMEFYLDKLSDKEIIALFKKAKLSLNESVKKTSFSAKLGKYDEYFGRLKTVIGIETENDKIADESYSETFIVFEENEWEIKKLNSSSDIIISKFKLEIKKAVEEMLKNDTEDYFKEDSEDNWVARRDVTFEIMIPEKAVR